VGERKRIRLIFGEREGTSMRLKEKVAVGFRIGMCRVVRNRVIKRKGESGKYQRGEEDRVLRGVV